MTLGTLEILATIIIAVSLIKIVVLLVNPKIWLTFSKRIYRRPHITKVVSLILAAIVLYYLVISGISIVEVLAVSLFVSLMLAAGLSDYGEDIINKIRRKDILKDFWLYTLAWLVLIVWGIKKIFFS